MRVDAKGWLEAAPAGVPVLHLPSARTTALGPAGARGLVWHATGGVGRPGAAERLARRIQTYRPGVDRPASWHLLVGKDGTVYQSASVLRRNVAHRQARRRGRPPPRERQRSDDRR